MTKVSVSFASGTYKITTAIIHTIAISNHTQVFITHEQILFDQEKPTNGNFSLMGKEWRELSDNKLLEKLRL